MAANHQDLLEAALAAIETGMPKTVSSKREDLTKVPSYHAGLGAPYSPQAIVDHNNAVLAAQGVHGVREDYIVTLEDGTVVSAGHGYRYDGKAPAVALKTAA